MIDITKTSYTFCPASPNSFNDLYVLYAANIPNTATIVNFWANVRGKESNHNVYRMAHSRTKVLCQATSLLCYIVHMTMKLQT